MRRRWLGAVVTALALGSLGLVPSLATETVSTFDWQVVVITAGSHGARNVWVGQSLVGSSTDNNQTFVVGVGQPARGASYGFSDNVPWDPEAPAVTTTRRLGGAEFTLVQQDSPHGTSSGLASMIPEMARGETMAIIDAQAHAQLTVGDVSEKIEQGSLTSVKVYRGTGTDYLRFADATDLGIAAAVGPVAAGSVTATPRMTRAIVGVSTYYNEGEVKGTWRGPTGPAHPFKSYFTPVSACADLGNWF